MHTLTHGELKQNIKKSLSAIKLSGIREDNTKEFYKKILSNSKPQKFYITYPDGHGDQALIFTRVTTNEKIRFVSIVINTDTGIKDCFGFFEISQFECDKILERFLRDEKTVSLPPETFKTILYNAELTTIQKNNNNWKLPYEYVCWKNLLVDIDYDNNKIEDILKKNVSVQNVSYTDIKTLDEFKISTHWFLDYQYSDEFEEALKELKSEPNLEIWIEKHLDKVFYPEEKQSWIKKLLISAYIKFSIGKNNDAQILYSFTEDETTLQELFKNILQRSVYEYLMLIKYDKNIPHNNLTAEDIDNKINYIEQKWVQNV